MNDLPSAPVSAGVTQENPLIHLVYASVAGPDFSKTQILEMLQLARKNNHSLGITGMLLFSDKSFFQVLEGPRAAVHALFDKIREDSRHRQIVKVFEKSIATACFKDWNMGLAFLEREQLERTPGCNDFFTQGRCLGDIDPSTAKKLLESFKDGFWKLAVK